MSSTTLNLLKKAKRGDKKCLEELINRLYDRFQRLASKILGDFPSIKNRGIQTGDVLHDIQDAFTNVENVETVHHLFNRVACSVRNKLIDLSKSKPIELEDNGLPSDIDELGGVGGRRAKSCLAPTRFNTVR